jgi:phenylacetic acid degradation protein paaN
VLPLALTVQVAREVLTEAGFDPNLVALAAERPGEGIAKTLATRPEIRIIDYTGSTAFGDWLETNARQAQVYTEKAGVNTVIVESTDDYKGMLSNLAFSLSLYSGQMCTTPQNLLIPRDGIRTDEGEKSYDEVVADLAKSVGGLLGDDARANALLGAIVNPDVKARLEAAAGLGEVALPSRQIDNPEFPGAVVRSPVIVKLDGARKSWETAEGADEEAAYMSECFGPVSFAVAVDSAADAVELLRRTVRDKGAMTVGAYTTDEAFESEVREACLEECAQLSLNLTGGVYVNQTAAFSDFHGSGGNGAANAALCDGAFVANRFRVIEIRREA